MAMDFSVFFIGPTLGQGTERQVFDAILREAALAKRSALMPYGWRSTTLTPPFPPSPRRT